MQIQMPSLVTVVRPGGSRVLAAYREFTRATDDGLPSPRVLLAFPVLLALLGVLLIGLGINGTSSGVLFASVQTGHDPSLLAGEPRPIRSDEWNVGTVWSIAQVEEGLPEVSEVFPGGMDAAIPYDLPRADWSVAFRPHLIGFLFLDAGHGTAWRWWVPGLALMAAAYCLIVTAVPTRPASAAVIAIGFFFSPFFQWWYQPSTFWPAAWALAAISAVWWSLRSSSRRSRWVWSVVVFYLSCVTAMGIYAPFIIPAGLVVVAISLGSLMERVRVHSGWRKTTGRLVPLSTAAIGAVVVCVVWLQTKATVVASLSATVYPGERLTPPGTGGALSVARTVSSAFAESLVRADGFLGINSSEASTFFLSGLWLLPVLGWVALRRKRTGGPTPWASLGGALIVVIFAAFTIIPGWDGVAHALLLDRTTADRLRIGLGIASLALTALTLRETSSLKIPMKVALTAGLLFVGTQCAVAVAMASVLGVDRVAHDAPTWWLWTALSGACLVLVTNPRLVPAGAIIFLIVGVGSSFLVNPVYRGVFDLRSTPLGEDFSSTAGRSEGTWVGIGGPLVTALLVESGVEAYNGTQGAPSAEMWEDIDPGAQFVGTWNRIGGVSWTEGSGEPTMSNPSADQILVTFDACSSFAQTYVENVLSDSELPRACLREVDRFDTAEGALWSYRVVGPD